MLSPECHTILVGKQKLAIQGHYRIAHNVDIDDYENNEHMVNMHNRDIHSEVDAAESNPHVYYSIKYINDNAKTKIKSSYNMPDILEEKGYKTFIVADYVEYCKETNISKCLIKNCERGMSGRRTGNIKRHYDKVHNFIILHEKISAVNKELDLYYNNDNFGDNTFYEENEEEMCNLSDHHSSFTVNLQQYVDYDTLTDKSLCKVPGCKTYLQGKKDFTIKRHYGLVHNYDIESNGAKVYNKNFKNCNVPFQNISAIPAEDLVIYDIRTTSYQCLFNNCNEVLDKHLPTLKRHYHEMHKIIIARYSDSIPHNLYKKRKRDGNNPFKSVFSREDEEFIDESQLCLVKNEVLSDDDYPHCSKRFNAYQKTFSIKKVVSESADTQSKSTEVEITKQEFFKLCLDLVIDRDIKLSLFDDEKLFKKLLVPFEQAFDCHVDSSLVQSLMLAANNIVMSALKEMFINKIVCLELHIVNCEKQYYSILNVRFLDEQVICNKVIGFLPITKAGNAILPIFEYLNKFNIDKHQVYMTTIAVSFQDDKEIDEICNNLCKHNPNIKKHPIFHIQAILRSFVHKYSEDINRLEELTNSKCKLNMAVFSNVVELGNYIKNLSGKGVDLKSQLWEAKPFMKTLEILRNFIEKVTEEQYVAGDFYRDWLCCELELKELTKNNNAYASKLYQDFTEYKTTLLQSNELAAALYLDVRFNFLGSSLLSDNIKTKGKLFLCSIWENFNKFMQSSKSSVDLLVIDGNFDYAANDDGYGLLNQYVNDIMPKTASVCIQDMITTCVPYRRQPFSLDILKYWNNKRMDMKDINELTKIAFSYPSSQFVLTYLQKSFTFYYRDTDTFDKFLIKYNQSILEKNLDLLFKDFKSSL